MFSPQTVAGVTKTVGKVSKEDDKVIGVYGFDTGLPLEEVSQRMVFVQGRDHFAWPALEIGYHRIVESLDMETLSVEPPIFQIANFLSSEVNLQTLK